MLLVANEYCLKKRGRGLVRGLEEAKPEKLRLVERRHDVVTLRLLKGTPREQLQGGGWIP